MKWNRWTLFRLWWCQLFDDSAGWLHSAEINMHRRIQHFTTARQCADGCVCYVMWWKVYNYKLSGSNFDALSCFDCVSIPGARWHSARSMCQLVYKPLIVDAVFSGSGNSSICPDSTQCSSPLLADSIIHSGFQQSLAKRMFFWCSCLNYKLLLATESTWRQPSHQLRETRIKKNSRYH